MARYFVVNSSKGKVAVKLHRKFSNTTSTVLKKNILRSYRIRKISVRKVKPSRFDELVEHRKGRKFSKSRYAATAYKL